MMAQQDTPAIGVFCCVQCGESFSNLSQAVNHIHTQNRTSTKNSCGCHDGETVSPDTRAPEEARTGDQPQISHFSDHVEYYGLKVLISKTGETGLEDDTSTGMRSVTVSDKESTKCPNKENLFLTEQRMGSVESTANMNQDMKAVIDEKPQIQSEETTGVSSSIHEKENLSPEVNKLSLLQTWTEENPTGIMMETTEKPVSVIYPGLKGMENPQRIAETSSPSQNTTCYFDAYTMKELDTQLLGLFSFGSDEPWDDDSPETTQLHPNCGHHGEWSDDLMNETTNIHTKCDPCEQVKDETPDIIHNDDQHYKLSHDVMNETASIYKNCNLHEQPKDETSHVLPNYCQHDQLSNDQAIENSQKNSDRPCDNVIDEMPHIYRPSGQGNEQLDSLVDGALHKLTNSGQCDEWFEPNPIPPIGTPIGTIFTKSCESNDVREDIKDPDLVKPHRTDSCEADYVTLDTKTLDLVHTSIGTISTQNSESDERSKIISDTKNTKQMGNTESEDHIYHSKGQVISAGLRMLTLFTCRHCGRRFDSLRDATTHWQTSCALTSEIRTSSKPYTMVDIKQTPDISSISGQVETLVLSGQECSTEEMVNTGLEFDALSAAVLCIATRKKSSPHGKPVTEKTLCKRVKGKKPHRCNTCGKHLSSWGALKEHTMIHTGEPKRHECSVCQRRFARPSYLNYHMASHAESYNCFQCKSRFVTLSLLHEHKMKVHPQHKSHECSECGKVLSSLSSLCYHMLLHNAEKTGPGSHLDEPVQTDQATKDTRPSVRHTSSPKPLKRRKLRECITCGKFLSSSGALKEHTMIHTGEPKRHECMVCHKRFSRPFSLKDHLVRHHSGWTPFKCSQCKDVFVTIPLLEKHIMKAHTEWKCIECSVCSKILSNPDLLHIHMAAHSRETAKKGPSTNEPVHAEAHDIDRPYPYYSTSQPVGVAAINTTKHDLGSDVNEPDHVVAHNTEISNLDSDTFEAVGVSACNTERPNMGYHTSQVVKVYNAEAPNLSADGVDGVEACSSETPNPGCQTNEPGSIKVHCTERTSLGLYTSEPQELHNMETPSPYSDTSETVAGEVLNIDRPNPGSDTSFSDTSEPFGVKAYNIETINFNSDTSGPVAREALNTKSGSDTNDPEGVRMPNTEKPNPGYHSSQLGGVKVHDTEKLNPGSDTCDPEGIKPPNTEGPTLDCHPSAACDTKRSDLESLISQPQGVKAHNAEVQNTASYTIQSVHLESCNTKRPNQSYPTCPTVGVNEGSTRRPDPHTDKPNPDTCVPGGIKPHNTERPTLDYHPNEACDTKRTDLENHTSQPQGVKASYISQSVHLESYNTKTPNQGYPTCQTVGVNESSTRISGPNSHTNKPDFAETCYTERRDLGPDLGSDRNRYVLMETQNTEPPKQGPYASLAVDMEACDTDRPKLGCYTSVAVSMLPHSTERRTPDSHEMELECIKAYNTERPSKLGVKAITAHTSERPDLGYHTSEPVNRETSNIGSDTNEPVGLQVEQVTGNKPQPLKDKSLQQHVKAKKLHECSTCGKHLWSYSALKKHMMIHTGKQKGYECIVCNARFKWPSGIKQHIRKRHTAKDLMEYENECSHRQSNTIIYKCSICHQGFRKIKYLDKHIKTHVKVFSKSHKCPVCYERFAIPWDLVEHLKTHPGIGPVACCYCCKKYQNVELLVLHMQHHKRLLPKSQTCYICKQHFKEKSALRKHLFSVMQKRTWSCSICSEKFAYASNLKLHLRIHRGVTPNFCASCDKWFSTAEGLNAHTCCPEKDKYKCCHCGVIFSPLSDFMQHVSKVQPGVQLFVCMTCGRLLCTNKDLYSHMRWCHHKV